ncbi:hypothetical protein AMJ74_06610 [candidate division WOR_3 bacterium SM1_77]|uniref:Potassium transporter TrkA n=1 Tax=candidate division WOR_3 bacterium SM1_77 TaxID=1703778 RepID=A0A0S8JRY0_UNCW3|nr:MAG: hypothetical protein AMJ74_06610 [candidate division WOR_3 bacterium SM1_77]
MQKRILIFAALIIAIIVIGVFGYYFIESLSFIDALYMTVITISTVGFGEVRSLSNAGKIFTIILIVCGIAIITTGVSMIFTAILEGTFRDTLRRHRMAKRLEKIRGHFIICGFGQVGHDVIDEFTRAQEEFVIIEKHEERLDILQEKKSELLYVLGDATEDEILKKAGIERAKGIIAVTGSDTDNLYICLSARALNPRLRIIARVIESEAAAKVRKAGADYVFSPEKIGGVRLAAAALRPAVTSFLDTILKGEYYELMLDEVVVESQSPFVEKTLQETNISQDIGIIIPAIKSHKQEKLVFNPGPKTFNPGPKTKISAGDVLIVFGTPEQIRQLNKSCQR